MRATLGLPETAIICAGTTDGVASFIATRAAAPGDAVTSLGTTLVLKLLSDQPIFAPAQGVYSHRLGDRWLAGGASNTGGGALLAHFSAERDGGADAAARSRTRRPASTTTRCPSPGERFPISDPQLAPRVTPRPADDVQFFQGLLEGIAAVEGLAYQALRELGAPTLSHVISIGGGARNPAWTAIRQRILGVPVSVAEETEASFGTALLALHGGPP